MTSTDGFPLFGGCDCRSIRYRMDTRPLFVHCCHCRWCQRESGASFALNAMIETDRVSLLAGEPEILDTPSESGRGQKIARCPKCRIAVWSNYAGAGPAVRFVRVGTLDEPDRLPPDIHIFTTSKQPWVVLPAGAPAVPEYYDRNQYWPKESLARREALAPGPDSGFLTRLDAAHLPLKQAQWVFGSRFGTSQSDRAMARAAWAHPKLAFYRWFAREPMLLRVDSGNPSSCAWFEDLRFFTPGRGAWPFRFGMCREGGGEWRLYQLLGENTRHRIDP